MPEIDFISDKFFYFWAANVSASINLGAIIVFTTLKILMQQTEWFASWFDTPYYDLLYSHRDDAEASVFTKKIIETLTLQPGTSVLDIGCGKGRHSRMLSAEGMNVTGIDLSPQKIEAASYFENQTLRFAVWDMRKVFKQEGFDVAINCFSSFGYFDTPEENLEALKAMCANVKKSGYFILDYFNAEHVITTMKPREIVIMEDIQFHISRTVTNGMVVKKIAFLHNGENHEFEERLCVIKPEIFLKMFELCGVKIEAIYGTYRFDSFQPHSSPRMIFIGKKN
jgi:2-polyprenyl-3-methyl-5-hydroxy-6-metoxy-1,4-benzoquinol methylase